MQSFHLSTPPSVSDYDSFSTPTLSPHQQHSPLNLKKKELICEDNNIKKSLPQWVTTEFYPFICHVSSVRLSFICSIHLFEFFFYYRLRGFSLESEKGLDVIFGGRGRGVRRNAPSLLLGEFIGLFEWNIRWWVVRVMEIWIDLTFEIRFFHFIFIRKVFFYYIL